MIKRKPMNPRKSAINYTLETKHSFRSVFARDCLKVFMLDKFPYSDHLFAVGGLTKLPLSALTFREQTPERP